MEEVMIYENEKNNTEQVQMVSVEQLVPKDHILRKIDKYIDFNFIYDLVEDKYSQTTGRPSIDPVVLIKLVILQYFFNINSMRQTIREKEELIKNHSIQNNTNMMKQTTAKYARKTKSFSTQQQTEKAIEYIRARRAYVKTVQV